MKKLVTYSQNREDIILEAMLKHVKQGFYVDVGANHPVNHSVTKKFYDRGWTGINIEPIPKFIELLETQRPKDNNLQICIGEEAGELTFREYKNSGVSTLSAEMIDQNTKENIDDFIEYKVVVKRLSTVLEEAGVGVIHFLKVDVEGYEYEVLNSNNWKKYRPVLICVETNHEFTKDWAKLLTGHNYSNVFFDGLNDYYVDNEQKDLIGDFNYPRDILGGGKVVVPHPALHEMRLAEKGATDIQKEMQKVKLRDTMLRRQIAEKNRIIREGLGIKYHLKMLLKSLKRKVKRIVTGNENSAI
jgi:FkbM family methyltransferase